MRITLKFALSMVVGCSILVLLNLLPFLSKEKNHSYTNLLRHNEGILRSNLLLDTIGCKIAKLEPFDQSVRKFLPEGRRLKCVYKNDIVYTKGNKLIISRNHQTRRLGVKYCKYEVIWRPTDVATHHNYYVMRNQSEPFSDNHIISDDFIKVTCYNEMNNSVYRNAFSFIHKKPLVEKRCMESFKKVRNSSNFISVLMVGVDSVSRNNMIRYMPKTRKYLQQKMGALEFIGYNKVGLNTFPNLVPMTTGKFVHELPWNSTMRDKTFDRYNFIWKNFSENGFRTLYSEDCPALQAFDYMKKGFSKPITDYFDRPFTVALENMKDIWNSGHHCVHARPETKIALDYTKQFVKLFKDLPYFSFTFISRLTHEAVDEPSKADDLYVQFLRDINKESQLNSTFFIFFSDHGMRFGKFRQTSVGKIEERLPFLFIVVPDWFKEKHESFHNSLKTNRKRLVSPFDIYKTLVHILNIGKNHKESIGRGQSILFDIPSTRTCTEAGILQQWCTCFHDVTVLNLKDEFLNKAAKTFVENVNKQLSNYTQCHKLKLKRVQSATKSETKFDEGDETYAYYEIVLETEPGGGVFEVTMLYDATTKSIKRIGDISRISMYGKTSYCVDMVELKKICYCKIQM